jgi:predicted porin
MKKSLIALAVLAAASGAAMAQSSVTLFGVVDATVRYIDSDSTGTASGPATSLSNGGSQWSLTNSGLSSSRIGFRGTEDLGGGLNASFWLEAGVNNDNGSGSATSLNNVASSGGTSGSQGLTFNRRSTVSLAGSWGELRLGRDYVPYFWNTTIFDPFGTNGVGAVSNFTLKGLNVITDGAINTTSGGVRASNSLGYFMPNIAGFYGQAMYAMGENNNVTATATGTTSNPNKSDGNVVSARVGYAAGPVDIALGYGGTTFAPQRQYQVINLGGSWNFGAFKIMGLANWEEGDLSPATAALTNNTNLKVTTYMIGATMPLGAGELKGSATFGSGSYDLLDGQQYALGYVYNLSKRTALYTTGSYIVNSANGVTNAAGQTVIKGGVYGMGINPGVNGNTFGLDFGVRHSF